MNEFLTKIFDKLSTGFLPNVSVSVKLGAIGGIVLVVLFLICLGLANASKIAKYTKLLIAGSRKFARMEPITDENVDVVYDELKKHPEPVSTGWSLFLDQRVGAPSDYFPSRNVLTAREFNGKHTAGKSLFTILGAIVWMIVGLLGFAYFSQYDPSAFGNGTFVSIVLALEFLIIPIGLYIIFLLSLGIVNDKKLSRLAMAYTSFCEVLDDKVIVTDKEADEFVSDNLAEINKRVQELVAGKDEDEIVDIITVPKSIDPDLGKYPSVSEVLKNMGIYEEAEKPIESAEKPVEEEAPVAPVEEKPLTEEELAQLEFLDKAMEKEDFVRFALDNEDYIQELIKLAEQPQEEEPAPAISFEEMTEEETFEWVENVLQICEEALNDENVDPEDLDGMGVLMDEALASLDDPTCRAALTDYLGKLAEKYYSIVSE